MNRRLFLQFMGRGAFLSTAIGNTAFLQGCASIFPSRSPQFPSLEPNSDDNLSLVVGLHSHVLVKWEDKINSRGDLFGFNNDFLAVLPGTSSDECYLWANHEYIHPLFVSGFNPRAQPGIEKTKAQAFLEQKNVGGSYVHLQRKDGRWMLNSESHNSFRVDATTPMELISGRSILDSKVAIGTTGNCSGGKTPWNTILTCEENFHDFYGTTTYSKLNNTWTRQFHPPKSSMAWHGQFPHPPEHYGWVVEVNPKTKMAKKLTALGRFAHEGALVLTALDGRHVVYMGDDTQDEHFYKFISHKPGSLERGELYVADMSRGRWEHLSITNPKLKDHFLDQTDLLIRTREAAKLLGATPLDRPEGCAQDPIGKSIFINCTMNKAAGRPFGSILKVTEDQHNLLSMKFSSETFISGGEASGFACPDNMCFDARGNLWITTDIADYDLNLSPYKSFGNNGLFFIPLTGPDAGKAFRFAVAPKEAELTGPCFSLDGRTLFLSVQHPGANTRDLKQPTSHWPDGGSSLPRSAVVAITGPLLDSILGSRV